MEKNNYVPFVSEVETFNDTMGKPNNYIPVIPDEKEWMFVYNFILEELEEYKEACQKGDIVGVLDALIAEITVLREENLSLQQELAQNTSTTVQDALNTLQNLNG